MITPEIILRTKKKSAKLMFVKTKFAVEIKKLVITSFEAFKIKDEGLLSCCKYEFVFEKKIEDATIRNPVRVANI